MPGRFGTVGRACLCAAFGALAALLTACSSNQPVADGQLAQFATIRIDDEYGFPTEDEELYGTFGDVVAGAID